MTGIMQYIVTVPSMAGNVGGRMDILLRLNPLVLEGEYQASQNLTVDLTAVVSFL